MVDYLGNEVWFLFKIASHRFEIAGNIFLFDIQLTPGDSNHQGNWQSFELLGVLVIKGKN